MRFALLLIFFISVLQAQINPAHKCGFGQHGMSLERVASPQERIAPALDESYVSPTGIFRIHFTKDTLSSHTVVGSDVLGTPAFVLEAAIAADSAYSVLVGELGFYPPLSDQGIDGPELDIYIVDMKILVGSYYGLTRFENYTPSPTYLLVDNDYTESFYSTSGLNALRVTIAHEFFHMAQLRYSHPGFQDWSNIYWYEISSVWFEEFCYPDINDYHAYVVDNFSASQFPQLDDNYGLDMYGHGIYGQVLDKEYGTRNNKHIMVDLWENLSDKDAIDNLKATLSATPWNSSFAHSLEKYAVYNIFTGDRSISGKYYEDAAFFPEIRTKELSLSTTSMNTLDFQVKSLGIYYSTFNLNSGFSEFISRTESYGELVPSHFQVYSPNADFHDLTRLSANSWSDAVYMSPNVEVIQISINSDSLGIYCKTTLLPQMDFLVVSPNPINPGHDKLQLNFTRPQADELPIEIYNILGQPVYREIRQFPEGFIQTSIWIDPILASGVYILRIGSGRTANIQKFTVLR